MAFGWLTREWGVKIISLILAIGLWYYAIGEESMEIKRNIPLEIAIENEHISILKSSADHVLVTFAAPRGQLSNITTEDLKAVHHIGDDFKVTGDYSFRLQPRDIQLTSPYVRIIKIEPEVVQVTLDELILKRLEIKPAFLGEPAFGYKVKEDEIQMNPNAILIEGPKGQLEKLDFVKTKEIDLVGRIRSFRRTVIVDLPPNVKPLSESLVDVYIPFREEFDEKNFENIPVRVLRATDKNLEILLSPEAVSFILKGPKQELEKLESDKLMAFIDVYNLKTGEYDIPVDLILPEDVNLKDSSALVVKVTIKKI